MWVQDGVENQIVNSSKMEFKHVNPNGEIITTNNPNHMESFMFENYKNLV